MYDGAFEIDDHSRRICRTPQLCKFTAASGPQGPSRASFDEQLKRAGYIKLEETTDRGASSWSSSNCGPIEAAFPPDRVGLLTCSGNEVVSFAHDETYEDIPD